MFLNGDCAAARTAGIYIWAELAERLMWFQGVSAGRDSLWLIRGGGCYLIRGRGPGMASVTPL